MGKATLIAAIALSFFAVIMVFNTQDISRESASRQSEYQQSYMAKELAAKGRKLVLSSWIETNGSTASAFPTINIDGGTITLLADSTLDLSGDEISFTVRGVYDGTVHDITSNFRWNGFALNPFQIKAPDLEFAVHSDATLNFDNISVDDQSLEDLEGVLVDDLQLGDSLGSFNLGMPYLIAEIETSLENASMDVGVQGIYDGDRSTLETQAGMFFPDQVMQMVDSYLIANPGQEMIVTEAASVPAAFGLSGQTVLRVEGNTTLSSSVSGQGILIIEGDFVVPSDVSLDWQGIILIVPPAGSLTSTVDFSGTVNIDGSLVIIQEGLPNTGHMDFTVNYSPIPAWANAYGNTYPWWKHTHDFSSKYGTQVGFLSNQPGFPVHEGRANFKNFLNKLSPNDELVLELHNPHNHGLAILTIDLAGQPIVSHPIAAGFDPSIADTSNQFKTQPIRVGDLEHLDIAVTRLSSLKKLWDSPTPYPNCNDARNRDGPRCVGTSYERFDSFALRIYKLNAGVEEHRYDASLYWHRREDELEEFTDEMTQLVNDIKSIDYGLDINIGANTTITSNPAAANLLGSMAGVFTNIDNIGTWHRHWGKSDTGNPLYNTP